MKKDHLQKLTVSKNIESLFKLKKISFKDLKNIAPDEVLVFYEEVNKSLNLLKGRDRDDFLLQIEDILPNTTKNDLWEYNHNTITNAISTYIREFGQMPLKAQIAKDTGLSRQTIHKHLQGYTDNGLYLDYLKQFRFMSSALLSKVLKMGLNGDVRAARLYFEMLSNLNHQSQSIQEIKQQNNYIQINKMVLSQQKIEQLTPGQLTTIERFIEAAITQ